MTGVNPPAGESVLDGDSGLVPDLNTELAGAEAAQDSAAAAAGSPAPARRFAVYDTRLERYVTGVLSEAAARGHQPVSKGGRYRLHELDTTGHLVPVTFP